MGGLTTLRLAPVSAQSRRHACTFEGNCSWSVTTFWPRVAGVFLTTVASAYETAGMIATRVESSIPTSLAKRDRTSLQSWKKSSARIVAGTASRCTPAIPADCTRLESGDM